MNRPPPVLQLDAQYIARTVTLADCIAAVEQAFVAHGRGETLIPGLLHIDSAAGEFHIKAGGTDGDAGYLACKVNGGFFQNRARYGLPNIVGLILLSSARDGTPLAVMESGLITRLRTGAATAVAARRLARADSRTVAILGSGLQARIQLEALGLVLPLDRARIWSRSGAGTVAAAAELSERLGLEVTATGDIRDAVGDADVVVTCTSAKEWFLGKDMIGPGTFVAAVGADSPDKQEIEPALVAASRIVGDIVHQCAHVGELHHAIAAGLATESVACDLGKVLNDPGDLRAGVDEIVLFDSTGTALQDAAVAALVFERAIAAGDAPSFAFHNL